MHLFTWPYNPERSSVQGYNATFILKVSLDELICVYTIHHTCVSAAKLLHGLRVVCYRLHHYRFFKELTRARHAGFWFKKPEIKAAFLLL